VKLLIRGLALALAAIIMVASGMPVYAADTVTRLDFIKTVFRNIVFEQEVEIEIDFPDISEEDAPVVAAAVAAGIANGHDDGLFRPDEITTVEQAVAMVIKFLDLRDHALTLPDNIPEDQYVAPWIRPYLKWAMAYSDELLEHFEIGTPVTPEAIEVLKRIIVKHREPLWF